MVRSLVAIAVGGSLGALARFGLARFAQIAFGGTFPIGTLIANLVGCAMIGFLAIFFANRAGTSMGGPAMRSAVMIGFIGALTTFSTYCFESLDLIEKQRYAAALGNLLGSVVLGVLAVYVGLVLGRIAFPP
ncbi:MAG: fluoride efflux transporter CrcB [Planctomycetes bacterium]|nr:fluoride efflux transporter CrcB [Planctomycetota bacterium]